MLTAEDTSGVAKGCKLFLPLLDRLFKGAESNVGVGSTWYQHSY